MGLDNLYSMINEDYSLHDVVALSEIKTEEDKKRLAEDGYIILYTKDEWEKRSAIPAEKMFTKKFRFIPIGLLYVDFENYTYISTGMFHDEWMAPPSAQYKSGATTEEMFRAFDDFMEKRIAEAKKDAEEKNYSSILFPLESEQSGNLAARMLSEMAMREEPNEALFHAFLNGYTFCDNGAKELSIDAVKRLCKGQKENDRETVLRDLDKAGLAHGKDGIITIYRGEGSKSTPYAEAYSWSTSLDVACFFACKAGAEYARVYKGSVRASDVIAYVTDRNESEIVVLPECVFDVTSYIDCTTMDEFLFSVTKERDFLSSEKRKTVLGDTIRKADRLYRTHGASVTDHDKEHTFRVIILAMGIYNSIIAEKSDDAVSRREKVPKAVYSLDFRRLMDACIYHDVGRSNGGVDSGHGDASADIYLAEGNSDKATEFAIRFHCKPDEDAFKAAADFFGKSGCNERYWLIYNILKDADALDRFRFGHSEDGCKVSMLRLTESRKLFAVAKTLSEGSLGDPRKITV